jgi:predicted ATPase
MTETLAEALRDRKLLVVLDNCEQVIQAAATVAETLMRHCPRVALLATSREPLGIAGEHVFRVPSLTVPGPDDDLAVLAASEAVRLFVERASHQKAGFSLNRENAEIIGKLCRRLDGIPFALELAAARLRSLSVHDLDAHLDKRFRLLTGGSRTALPRQQTLQALIDWSYDLLHLPEQDVLGRLSVFAGGFDLEAAEAVGAGGDIEDFEVLEKLDALVDKSLVQADDTAGTVRYRLLESMRDYAGAKLAGRSEDEQSAVRRKHRDHFLALAEEAALHLRGEGEVAWADRLDIELDNLRVAMADCFCDPEPAPEDPGLRLATSLSEFWFIRGHGVEGATVLRSLLARPSTAAPTAVRGFGLAAAARLVLYYLADYPAAVVLANEALGIARDLSDDALAVRARLVLATAKGRQGDLAGCLDLIDETLPVARGLADPRSAAFLLNLQGLTSYEMGRDGRSSFEESVVLCRRAGDRRGAAAAAANIGVVALNAGEIDVARQLIGEALVVFRELGDRHSAVACAGNAGYIACLDKDAAAAFDLFHEALTVARRIGARPLMAYAILGLAFRATLAGYPERAATLHGFFDAWCEELGAAVEALEAQLRTADHARLKELLGEGPFAAAYQAGRALTLDRAMALATA